jgi:hypothetical protein
MEPQPKVPQLCIAIRGRRRISFVYHGRERVAEPQCYGISTAGKEALRVFLIQGRSGQPEPLFTVAEMEGLKLLQQTFAKPGPNYKQGDSAMKHIFCEL